jgi:hypothetical protein
MKEMRGARDRVATLELAWSKTRDGSRNKNRIKRMKCRPYSQQPTKGTSLNWIKRGKATSLDWGSS